ncbi:diacylglycerol/lipid kinase family protein [Aureispira anguillae]|uniref:Diacylglycerol kinase family lipid kinase n=1 Tax=Aureispira anguillae TaxID=2864201 RepID=A0A915YK19_9BACT|nr:diacylglycerol kinase family protein [Aureispira anguillae]BDS14356.1 diacylglycerol kinase family lipid kinase [Aureispira anguillae]
MNTHKWYFIVNPVAGNSRGTKHWHKIQFLLERAGITYDFGVSGYPRHSTHLATYAISKGYRHIAAIGGDGTINEVINGIFNQTQVPTAEITFGVIPMGTGNDWVKTHKIPTNYKAAIRILKNNKTQKHDVGKVYYYTKEHQQKSRYFINVAGLAYDAFVTKASQNRPKYGSSQLYYLYLIARCISQYKPTPIKFIFDGEEITHNFFNITIGQCRYNGGGTNLVPHANPKDGLFAFTLFKDVKAWEVIFKAPKFYTGSITRHKEAFMAQAKHIRIEAPKETPAFVEVDGEWLGQSPIEFHMLASAINITIP